MRVGYDLQPGLPGYSAVADFVDAGSKLANVQALESTVDMDVGDRLRIPAASTTCTRSPRSSSTR